MYFFTSDTHYSDTEMLRVMPRPFKTVEQMNEKIIKRFNERVKPEDTTFFLGDFRQGHGVPFADLVGMLNGNKIFIRGNHDGNNGTKTIIEHMTIEHFGYRVLLIHDPKDVWPGSHDLVFHGHVHKAWKFRRGMVNVGVDVWDYYPVSIKTAINGYFKWAKQNGIC